MAPENPLSGKRSEGLVLSPVQASQTAFSGKPQAASAASLELLRQIWWAKQKTSVQCLQAQGSTDIFNY